MRNLLILITIVAAAANFGSKWHWHNKVSEGMDTAVSMMLPYARVESQVSDDYHGNRSRKGERHDKD